ncbi:MAG: EAL domain-containing protein, partial [Desulfohalobiaceae bacterium]|nr:EAL domain-containing protein [Desulfohalobiaceae bacterium]
TSPDAVALVDEHGRFLTVNPVMAQHFNLTQDDLEGKTYYDVMPKDLADKRITDAIKSLNAQEFLCIEDERGDKYLQNYYIPISTSENQRTFQVISRDITTLKEQEKQLKDSEERFRQWFESSPISLWELDFSEIKKRIDEIKTRNVGDLDSYLRQRPELIWELAGMVSVLDVNQASLNLYRANSKEDFLGGITKIFSRESLEGFLQVLKVIAAGENTFVTEREHVTLDGEPRKVQFYWTVAKGYEETYARILVSIVDITDRKEAKERLQTAHNKLDTLVQLNADGLIVLNQEGEILFLNPAAAEMLGRNQEELWGEQFGHPVIPGSNTEIELLSTSGEARIVELRGRETEWSGQTALLVSFRDITERKQAEERIYNLAYYDELTAMPNRRLFHDRLKQISAQSEHLGHGGAVFMVDITRLRDMNDTLGQEAGDELIREVARRISDTVFEEDTVARVSGGEFMVLSEGRSTADRARNLGKRILEQIGWNLELSGRLVYPEVNIGFTLFPDWGTDPDTLIKQADIALSEAKKSAHRIQEFAGQEDWISRLFHLEHDLKKALLNEEFFLCYQPQIDLRSGRVMGLEALLRWEHPQRGIVSPGEFIPVLEQTGMIATADKWVIHRVCEQLRSWQENGVMVKTSVNLSAQELSNDATIEVFRAALEENGVHPESLEVEITETALMKNVDRASRILQTLSSWGVRVALDDFGKGYSSLSYLQQLAINTIKIDKQFVDGLPESEDSVTLVQTIIAMAHNLGKKVLAEGVEHEEQRQKLIELGCDYGQGFLWSHPQPVENLPLMES